MWGGEWSRKLLGDTCKGREEEKESKEGLHVIQSHPLRMMHFDQCNMLSYNL